MERVIFFMNLGVSYEVIINHKPYFKGIFFIITGKRKSVYAEVSFLSPCKYFYLCPL